MSIHAVVLTAHDERYAPPEKVLEVSVVDDVVFLHIGAYDETHEKSKIKVTAQIGVKLDELIYAMGCIKVQS